MLYCESMSTTGNSEACVKREECCCVVCEILDRGFSSFTYAEKKEIIEKGRETPALDNLKKRIKTCVRHFNKDIYSVEWLTGCKSRAKLFCWSCLLFSTEKSVWNNAGFSDLNNIHKVIKRHSSSKNHLHCILKLKTFNNNNQRIDHALNEQIKIHHQQHNEMVRKNHEILKRLIDVTCFLGSHDFSFHGHDESLYSVNRENYTDMVHFLAKYDPVLGNHLQNSSLFQGTSNLIHNDLISSIVTVTLDHIRQEISESPFVAIVLDETSDIGNKSQLSKIIRFVTKEGTVEDRFLGFEDISSDRTADVLYGVVCDVVNDLKCGDKLIAQSYDGASVMPGHLEDLQTKVKETFPNALFVHCMAHRLSLILSQSVSKIKECKTFFMTLAGMANFFSQSSKCCFALDKEVKKRLPNAAPIRWNYNSRLVQTVHEYRQPLISLFENIVEGGDDWDTETETTSKGYLNLLKRDFNFNLLLQIYSQIFPITENLFNVLQTKTNDIGFCVKKINDFKIFLRTQRENSFDSFWNHVMNTEDIAEPRRKMLRLDDTGDLEKCYRRLFYEIIDNIQEQINSRFSTFENLQFLELTKFEENYRVLFPQKAFDSLIHSYGSFFDLVALSAELSVIYNVAEGVNKRSVKDLLLFIRENKLEMAYSEVLKLCELVMTIPATTSSVEHIFSTLKRIKTFLSNTGTQDIPSNLAILCIEKALIKDLHKRPKFYDSVIADFAKKERRIPLHYK